MRMTVVIFVLLMLGLISSNNNVQGQTDATANQQPRLQILVPAYFYPAGPGLEYWDQMIEAASEVPIVAIVNPASGPGEQRDPNYEKIIKRAEQAGIKLVGYVSTRYAKRPAKEIKQDMDRWLEFYPTIQGFFMDEQATDEKLVEFYIQLSDHARSILKKPLMVSNPGTVCEQDFFTKQVADIFCVFENKIPLKKFQLPEWTTKENAKRCYVLAYNVKSTDKMRQSLKQAFDAGIGYVFITNDTGANPWDTLPDYWEKEVFAVKAMLLKTDN